VYSCADISSIGNISGALFDSHTSNKQTLENSCRKVYAQNENISGTSGAEKHTN